MVTDADRRMAASLPVHAYACAKVWAEFDKPEPCDCGTDEQIAEMLAEFRKRTEVGV